MQDPIGKALGAAALGIIALLAVSYDGDAEAASGVGPAPVAAAPVPVPVCDRPNLTASKAIDCLWPRSSRRLAHRVAECESTASASEGVARRRGLGRWARDYATGTHWGIFQLGPRERARHGQYRIGSPARVQVASAVSLYRERGWGPWSASSGCSGAR